MLFNSQESSPRDDTGRWFDAHSNAHVHARTRPSTTRPTKLIDAGLACPIPSSLAASAKHVSSQTSTASQDTISRRLRAGREQHQVETAASAVRGRWVAPSNSCRNASPATHLQALEGVCRPGSGCQRNKCKGPRLGRAC